MVAQIDSRYRATGLGRVLPRLLCYALFEGRPLTSRGRWINPLVLALARLHRSLPPLRSVDRPIFVIGVGRSGTTVVGATLSVHREVAWLNEPKALWHAGVGREDIHGHYDRGDARYRLTGNDADTLTAARMRRLYGACMFWTARRRIVETNAELIHRVPFLRTVFPDARFLVLTRNGRDVCQSVAAWSERHTVRKAGETHDWWGVDSRKWRTMLTALVPGDPDFGASIDALEALDDTRQRAAVEWSLAMRVALEERRRSPETVRLLPLVALAERPRAELAELVEFCRLDVDDRMERYAAERLRPSRTYERFDLDPAVAPAFHRQMQALEYDW